MGDWRNDGEPVEGGSGWRVSEGNIGCDNDGEPADGRGALL